jgi:hypothetical protein
VNQRSDDMDVPDAARSGHGERSFRFVADHGSQPAVRAELGHITRVAPIAEVEQRKRAAG